MISSGIHRVQGADRQLLASEKVMLLQNASLRETWQRIGRLTCAQPPAIRLVAKSGTETKIEIRQEDFGAQLTPELREEEERVSGLG